MKAKLTYRITRSSAHKNGHRENLFYHKISVFVANPNNDIITSISKSLDCEPRVTDAITLWTVNKNGSLVNVFGEQIDFVTELLDSNWEYATQRSAIRGLQCPIGCELGFNRQLVLAGGVNSSIYSFIAEYKRTT
jgi:hypothetical protein